VTFTVMMMFSWWR